MREIPLTKGKVAWVDDEDHAFLSQWPWHYHQGYAARSVRNEHGRPATILMHRVIVRPPDGRSVDHIDGNGLMNTRANLRTVSTQQNRWNSASNKGARSKFKGVHQDSRPGRWRTEIVVGGVRHHLGCFADEEAAAQAVNRAALELHGPFARLNDVPP